MSCLWDPSLCQGQLRIAGRGRRSQGGVWAEAARPFICLSPLHGLVACSLSLDP